MKRRLIRLFKVLMAVISILIIVAAFLSWQSFAAIEAALKPLRDRGEPVSIADLKPDPVADDENAATYLTPIMKEAEQFVNEAYPIAYAEDFSWRTGLTPDQTTQMRTLLDAHPDLTEQMLELNIRSIARFQVCRVRYLAAIDKPDEAAAVCLEELRLIRLQAETPFLVSWMVNVACRGEIFRQLNGILQTKTLQPETYAAIE